MSPRFSKVTGLARVAHPISSRGKWLAVFLAYFDESGHPSDTSILTLAALVAPAKAWTSFEAKWQRILRRYHIAVFHMSDYENRRGEFAGWDNDKRIRFVADLAAILKNTIVFGVAHSLVVREWNEIIAHHFDGNRFAIHRAPYVHLLAGCLEYIVRSIKLPHGETIACVFDEHKLIQHFSTLVYQALLHVRGWKNVFGSLTFANKAQITPLQAADMLAYEAFKYAEHWNDSQYERRKLLKNLSATDCIVFGRYNRQDLEDFRDKWRTFYELTAHEERDQGGNPPEF